MHYFFVKVEEIINETDGVEQVHTFNAPNNGGLYLEVCHTKNGGFEFEGLYLCSSLRSYDTPRNHGKYIDTPWLVEHVKTVWMPEHIHYMECELEAAA